MKHFIIFFFFYLTSFSQSEILIADYTFSTKFDILPNATIVNSRLISDGNNTAYEMDYVGNINFSDEEFGIGNNTIYSIKAKRNPVIFKNKNDRYIYSIERVMMKPFIVKDSMNIFKWKLHPEKKKILNYDCQKATTNYRGRDYTVYFTSSIPIKTGPWKFYGLPGLILQAQSDDGLLKIEINRINIKKSDILIDNPYQNQEKNSVSWDTYRKAYEKKYTEMQSYSSPNGGKIIIPKRLIETLIYDKVKSPVKESKYGFKTN